MARAATSSSIAAALAALATLAALAGCNARASSSSGSGSGGDEQARRLPTLDALEAPPPAAPPPAGDAPLANGTYRVLSAGDVEIVYHVFGEGPICMVHPGGPGLEWGYLRMPLLESELTMVYVEPASTGASGALPEAPEALRLRYAEDLEAVREAIGVDRVWLLGHSFGGLVAMRYAIEHGEHLDGLVLYSTSAVTDRQWRQDSYAAMRSFKRASWYEETRAAMAKPRPAPRFENDCTNFRVVAPFYFADYENRAAEIDELVDTLRCWEVPRRSDDEASDDLRPELAKLDVPTLVITGRRDWLFSPKWARATARAIPDGQVVVLEESGHFAHFEQPRAFAQAVIDFVRAR